MRVNYTLLSCLFLAASVPLAWRFLQAGSAGSSTPIVRIGSFNVALNRSKPGDLLAELQGGGSAVARRLAEIVQRCDIDVLLLCEVDRGNAAAAADAFADEYLAVGQGQQQGIEFPYRYCGEVNTGVPSGLDLDGDGAVGGPADAWGFGRFPGQYGMAVLSRHPILIDRVRTFRELRWSAMPNAQRPADFYPDETWTQLRLSSKSHWDVPIGIGPVAEARVVHLLCSHPTPPAFDGEEDRNGCRNHDEIRFWVDYLTAGRDGWIVDDDGTEGGLAADASFVILGDLNCDPIDGDSRRAAIVELLDHRRVTDPQQVSTGGAYAAKKQSGANRGQQAPAARDTADFSDKPDRGPGNLRVDYALPSSNMTVTGGGVFWPLPHEPGSALVGASDHRLVWVDLAMR